MRAMFTPHVIGETTRGLGWDMSSAYSRTLGSFFPEGSAGHTGFTGPSMWLDPVEPALRDHHDQSRASEREGLGGGIAPPHQRRRRARARRRPASRWPSRRRETGSGPATVWPTWPAGMTLTGLDRLVAENFAPTRRSLGRAS